jgi:hypothetical protein
MAINEACQVWIEQEIDTGLAEGKNPHAIGQLIAKEVEKLFEVKIKPRTIEQRARRQNSKDATNVASDENQPEQSRTPSLRERKEELGGKYGFRGAMLKEGEELPPEYQELDRIRKALGFKRLPRFYDEILAGTVTITEMFMRFIHGKGKVLDEEFREWFERNKKERSDDGKYCWFCLDEKPLNEKIALCERCIKRTERDKEKCAIQDRGVTEEDTKVWTDIHNDSLSLLERIVKALAEGPPGIAIDLAKNIQQTFKEIGEHAHGDLQEVVDQYRLAGG